jgi:hypothetical protein
VPPQLPLPLAAARSGPQGSPAAAGAKEGPLHRVGAREVVKRRDTSDPDLAALLAAENAYADAFVGSAAAAGLRARLPRSTVAPLQPWGPWFVPRCLTAPVSV